MQHDLEVTTKQPIFVDSSISDTIRTCIVLGNHRAALKVKTEFKVIDLWTFMLMSITASIDTGKKLLVLTFVLLTYISTVLLLLSS